MCEPVKYAVSIGESARDYRIGDYLNAVDELTCYFEQASDNEREDFANALELYAKYLRGQ